MQYDCGASRVYLPYGQRGLPLVDPRSERVPSPIDLRYERSVSSAQKDFVLQKSLHDASAESMLCSADDATHEGL